MDNVKVKKAELFLLSMKLAATAIFKDKASFCHTEKKE
jgi:hypothetical protein